ncbi:hypothetical protein HELA111659_02820 [Helicobacter labetoulli]
MTFAQEKDLQNEIANNQNLQRDICSVLDMDFYQIKHFNAIIKTIIFKYLIGLQQ